MPDQRHSIFRLDKNDFETISFFARKVWRYFSLFSIVFIVLYIALFAYQFVTESIAYTPSISQIMLWFLAGLSIYSLIVLILYATQIVRDYINKIGERSSGYTPNHINIMHVMHATLAFTWTASTSAIGIKSVIAPNTSWIDASNFIPVLGGVMAGITVLGFWTGFIHLLDKDSDRASQERANSSFKTFLNVFVFAFFAGGTIFVLSTVTSVIGTAGNEAIIAHLRHSLDEVEQDLETAIDYRNEELRIGQILSGIADNFERASENECQEGTYTGRAGCGELAVWLGDQSTQLRALADRTKNNLLTVTGKSNATLQEVAALRDYVLDAAIRLPVAVVQNEYRIRYAPIRSQSALVIQDTALPTIENQLSALSSFFNDGQAEEILGKRSANAELAQDQLGAAKVFINQLKDQYVSALEQVRELSARESVVISSFEPITIPESVVYYWRSIVPTWAIAIAVDFSLLLWAFWVWQSGSRRVFDADFAKAPK